MDSYEQPIERPSAYETPKNYYSGKKKTHTRKNQLIVLPNGKDIVDVVAGEPGPKSDVYFVKLIKNLNPTKGSMATKLIKDKNQLKPRRKNRKNKN